MTRITDDTGTRWVDDQPRKRRKSPRALRFANIKVGDQLMKTTVAKGWRGGRVKPGDPPTELSRHTRYFLVTDLWFDPVAGQTNHVAGEMVAIAQIRSDGSIADRKEPHTKRGLASQGFHPADRDYIDFTKKRLEAENVVGIGRRRHLLLDDTAIT
jgi:hypothetical protein